MIYRKFRICEDSLYMAAEQLYRINGRYPTRREAAEWFRDWADKQPRTYHIHPLLTWSAFLIGLFVGAAPLSFIFELLGVQPTGVLSVLQGICALAGGVGLVLLLTMVQTKYESYRWERLIESRPSGSFARIDEYEALLKFWGIRCVNGEFRVGDARFSDLDDAVNYARRIRK